MTGDGGLGEALNDAREAQAERAQRAAAEASAAAGRTAEAAEVLSAAGREFAARARAANVPLAEVSFHVGYHTRRSGGLLSRKRYEIPTHKPLKCWVVRPYYPGDQRDWDPSPGIFVLEDGRCVVGGPSLVQPGTRLQMDHGTVVRALAAYLIDNGG